MVTEMRMIRRIYGYSILDRIKNVMIREKVGVAPIEDKMSETRLRWFGHTKRKSVNASMRRYETINLTHCRRGRGEGEEDKRQVETRLLDVI